MELGKTPVPRRPEGPVRAEYLRRVRALLLRSRASVGAVAVLAVFGGFVIAAALVAHGAPGGVATEGNVALVSYHGPRDHEGGGGDHEGIHFAIAGNATEVLYPGTTSPIDLTFSNETKEPITLPATAITVTVTSPSSGCRVRNFQVQTLRAGLRIPAHSVGVSLSSRGITPGRWPRIKMLTTGVTQDACQGLTLTLHYSYSPRGGGDDH